MLKTKVTIKGQTVVPAPLRKRFSIDSKSQLVWSAVGDKIEVTPIPANPVKALRGLSEKHPLRRALLRKRSEDKAID